MVMINERLDRWAADIEKRLEFMTCMLSPPDFMGETIRYSLLGGGKRLRGAMLLAANEALGGDYNEALPFAAALEMIHCFSLIHDDLPAMDNDDVRRGKPSNHIKFGEGFAILAGDTLLAFAAEQMMNEASNEPKRMAPRLNAALAIMHAASVRGIAGGQYLDLLGANAAELRDADDHKRSEWTIMLDRLKTAALFQAAVAAGFILAGGGEAEEDIAFTYGNMLGLAFQVRDDMLDIEGDPAAMGKRTGKDADKLTLPAIEGMEWCQRLVDMVENEALNSLKPLGEKGELLAGFVDIIREYSVKSKA
ncbi:geranylgeranyl pyrophosphate synthase [Clostridia bacterium]|nr:geranylgeranyl pyrophosphate synthase [Clostridia bacterium]